MLPLMDHDELTWKLASLVVLFALCFAANGLVPAPVTSCIFWLGQYDYPAAVVVVATLGSLCGWPLTAKYIKILFDKKPDLVDHIPAIYRRFFEKKLGLAVFICNALPFPWDPARLLAILYNYSPKKLLLAIGAGRLVRNILLVTLGAALAPYKTLFMVVLVLLVVLPFVINRFYLAFQSGSKEHKPPEQSAKAPAESGNEAHTP